MDPSSHQVIGQPLENLNDALYPYKNASKLSKCMLIDVLKLHLENARFADRDKILFFQDLSSQILFFK